MAKRKGCNPGEKRIEGKCRKKIKDWKNVRTGTAIYLTEKKKYPTIVKEKDVLDPGKYYIVGYWANVMGLSKLKRRVHDGFAEIHISPIHLKDFYR